MSAFQDVVNSGQWNVSMAITFANNTLALNNYDTTNTRYKALSVLGDYEFLYEVEEMPEEFSPYSIYTCGLSDMAAYILDTLCKGVYRMAIEDSIIDYVIYKSRIMQCEVSVMSNDYLSVADKLELLSSMSILRHSLWFWNQIDDEYPNMQPKAKVAKWIKYTLIGIADAVGGTAGAVAGFATGGVAGGVAGGLSVGLTTSNGTATLIKNVEEISNQNNNSGNGNGNGSGDGNGGGDGGNPVGGTN